MSCDDNFGGPRSRAAPHSQFIQYTDSVVRPFSPMFVFQVTIILAATLVGFEGPNGHPPQVAALHRDKSPSEDSLCLGWVPRTQAVEQTLRL
jgi:hypothetical protein